MNARVRESADAPMDETIDYGTNYDRTPGFPTMPNAPTSQAPFRYTYGSGARPLDGYTIKRAIGRGGFGEVYYATSDSGKEVALKLITRNVEIERRGVAQCMNLKCPNLLAIYDIRANDAGETFVVMEYVSGPSLAAVLEGYPDGMPINEVRAWLKGLVEGVDYLHDHGVVHRDLKPANLFMEEGVVKIGDYGLSKIISASQGSEHSESIGTCHYMAPEISTGKYNKPIDIYAIGVILYEMLTGRWPFDGETVGEVLMKHLTTRPDLSRLAEPYRTIVGEALAKDPANRPRRAHDLLGPDAGPRVRDVRFIGEGKTVPATEADPSSGLRWPWRPRKTPAPARPASPVAEEIHRIGEVEPIFYIGPDTRPPRPSPPPRVARGGMPRPARPAPAPPPPPPVAPELPGRRARLAELAMAMVWAAPASAVLAWSAAAALELRPEAHPENVAMLFAMTLVGTWAAIVPAKFLEGSGVAGSIRRLVGLLAGAGVGLFGTWLADWLRVDAGGPAGRLAYAVGIVGPGAFALTLGLYFAASFGAIAWWRLADRDRRGQIYLGPVALSGLIAAVLAPLLPVHLAWVAASVPLVALTTQVVSPWNRQAAAYAAYAQAEARKAARAA